MASGPMDLGTAARFTRFGQVGAIVLAGCAAGAMVLVDGRTSVAKAPDEQSLKLPAVDERDENKPVSVEPADLLAVADRLGQIANRPKAIELPATPENSQAAIDTPPKPPEPTGVLKYLGMVKFGQLKMGLVVDGTKQRFVKAGDELSEGTVSEVTQEHVSLTPKSGGTAKLLELAPKSSDVVTRTTGGGPIPMMNGAGGANGANMMGGLPVNSGVPVVQSGRTPKGTLKRPTPPSNNFAPGVNKAMPISTLSGQERSQRIQQMREQMKASGQYKTDGELNAALSRAVMEDPHLMPHRDQQQGGADQ